VEHLQGLCLSRDFCETRGCNPYLKYNSCRYLEKNVREKSFHPLYRSEQDRGDEKARSKFFSEKKSGKNHFTLFTDQSRTEQGFQTEPAALNKQI